MKITTKKEKLAELIALKSSLLTQRSALFQQSMEIDRQISELQGISTQVTSSKSLFSRAELQELYSDIY